jgi:cell division protein FtsB
MSNNKNTILYEEFFNEGREGGLNDFRAEHYVRWRLNRDGKGTVKEYMNSNPFNFNSYSELQDKLNVLTRRNDILEHKIKLLENEVKETQCSLNRSHVRLAKLNTEKYEAEQNQKTDVIQGSLIDVTS